jgi:C1A family cysteine protease
MSRLVKINRKKRHLFGWKRDRPDHRDLLFQVSRSNAKVYRSVDLRSFCSRIEDQGHIGSCTANAATSAIELLYIKDKLLQPELSRLFLYYATRVWVAKDSPSEDNGATIRDVMRALACYGTCLESIWPYSVSAFSKLPSSVAKRDATGHQILNYYRIPSLSSLKVCMSQGYPVVGGFSVPASMMEEETEKTGVVRYPMPAEEFVGGHAVLFVGYDDTKKLITFQNSWGTGWGDKGFGYLPYDFVTNWLANDLWTIRTAEM